MLSLREPPTRPGISKQKQKTLWMRALRAGNKRATSPKDDVDLAAVSLMRSAYRTSTTMKQTRQRFVLTSLLLAVLVGCFSFMTWKTEVLAIIDQPPQQQRLSEDQSPSPMANSTETSMLTNTSVLLSWTSVVADLTSSPHSQNSTTSSTTTPIATPLNDEAMLLTMLQENACKTLNETVLQVGSKLQDPNKVASRPSWIPPVLSCDKLQRGLPQQYWWLPPPPAASQQQSNISSNPYLKQLLALISRLERGEEPIKIVILGGSMTAGHRDDIKGAGKDGAWPHKLEMLLHQIWPSDIVTVENHAQGAVSETFWLENFHLVKRMEPFDLLIGEWAVNDQCDYKLKAQCASKFNQTSHSLINEILWLPSNPAVLSIELFRTAFHAESD